MNRTIKEEFGMDKILKSKEQLTQLVAESVFLYNTKRPHLALKMKPRTSLSNKNPGYLRQPEIFLNLSTYFKTLPNYCLQVPLHQCL